MPENVVSSVKQHLFVTEHRTPVGPNQWRTGSFYPSKEIADLWQAATGGKRIDEFRHFLGHEYLESTLMKHMNVPYKSPHPSYWQLNDEGVWEPWPTATHYGAHDLAPRAVQGDLTPRQLERWEHFFGGEQ